MVKYSFTRILKVHYDLHGAEGIQIIITHDQTQNWRLISGQHTEETSLMKTRYHSPALFSQKYIQRTSLIEDIYLDCCPLLRLLPSYPPLLTNTSPKTRRLRHTLYPVQNIFKKRCPIWWWMYPGIHYIFTEFDLCLRCRTLLKHSIKSTLISISWQIVFSLRNLRYLSLSRNVFTSMNLTDFFFSNETVYNYTMKLF